MATDFKTSIEKVSEDVDTNYFKITTIIEGHKTVAVLEKSQIREMIGLYDNAVN